jgi:MSHA biogenesis protein MshL
MMKKTLISMMVLSLVGCATPEANRQTYDLITAEMDKAVAEKPAAAVPSAVSAALLPPIETVRPPVARPAEERFSVAFNDVPASRFFMSIASGTRYNMLVHPAVSGTISANLKDVTLFEALSAVRDMYGYDYTVEGNRIVIKPLTLQTRIFHVNYLNGNRLGMSETRVSSGTGSAAQPGTTNPSSGSASGSPASGSGSQGTSGTVRTNESSRISSSSTSDFWGELKESLRAIVGVEEIDGKSAGKEGRNVVVSPQSGVIVVRAMPDELRAVSEYLKASQISVERQVILEAKILEVQLNDSFQAGINWASFGAVSAGLIAPGTQLTNQHASNTLSTSLNTVNPITGNSGNTILDVATRLGMVATGNAAGSLFGLAFQSNNFSALLTFLETQGNVHVLSSPRIATLNNQKAILKVGTDDFFVTKVSTTTNTSGTSSVTTPEVTLQQFFSGVVLDVTPQIDGENNIILHVHPSVTQVSTLNKLVQLGTLGTLNLPLASSNTSETDSVVRGQNGGIIAIGGLMRQATTSDRSQVPGAGDVPFLGGLFRSTSRVTQKRELVILIKPTIVQSEADWNKDIVESRQRMEALNPQEKTGWR